MNTAEKAAVKEYRSAGTEIKLALERIFGKDIFKPKDITEKIQSLDDILELTDPDTETLEIINYTGKHPKKVGCKFFTLAELIAEAYNEGETPDATKEGVQIWSPFFNRLSLGFSLSRYVASSRTRLPAPALVSKTSGSQMMRGENSRMFTAI